MENYHMTKEQMFNQEDKRITNAMDAAAEKHNVVAHTSIPWDYGYGDNSKAFGIFTKKMLDEGLEESPICLISPIDKLNEVDKANATFICKAVNNHEELLNWCHKLYAVLFTSKLLDHKEMDALQTVIKNAE